MSFHIGRTITVAIATIAATVATSTAALAGPPSPTNPTVGEANRIMALSWEAFAAAPHSAPFDWSTDGCSSPLPATPLAEMFRPACALHDFGYRNYGARGAARSTTPEVKDWIDTRFDAELGRICKKNFGSGPTPTSLSPYQQCMQIAGSFIAAVRTKGDPYFF
jgi:hypothetical protein